MLVDFLALLFLGPLTACDTARAALGSCSSQVNAGVISGSGFELNISREVTTRESASSSNQGVGSSVSANLPFQAPTQRPPSSSSTTAPKPPSSAGTRARATTPPRSTSSSRPATQATRKPQPSCQVIIDPPLARFHPPPCMAAATPKPPVRSVPKPITTPSQVGPTPRPPLPEVVRVKPSTPPHSSATTSSQTTTERQTLAGFAPEVWLAPVGAARLNESVGFVVSAAQVETRGRLFSSPATIRFVPISATLNLGEGAEPARKQSPGFRASHQYHSAGSYRVQATVQFQVDYQIGTDPWVIGAARVGVTSNSVLVEIQEPLERTLLVPTRQTVN